MNIGLMITMNEDSEIIHVYNEYSKSRDHKGPLSDSAGNDGYYYSHFVQSIRNRRFIEDVCKVNKILASENPSFFKSGQYNWTFNPNNFRNYYEATYQHIVLNALSLLNWQIFGNESNNEINKTLQKICVRNIVSSTISPSKGSCKGFWYILIPTSFYFYFNAVITAFFECANAGKTRIEIPIISPITNYIGGFDLEKCVRIRYEHIVGILRFLINFGIENYNDSNPYSIHTQTVLNDHTISSLKEGPGKNNFENFLGIVLDIKKDTGYNLFSYFQLIATFALLHELAHIILQDDELKNRLYNQNNTNTDDNKINEDTNNYAVIMRVKEEFDADLLALSIYMSLFEHSNILNLISNGIDEQIGKCFGPCAFLLYGRLLLNIRIMYLSSLYCTENGTEYDSDFSNEPKTKAAKSIMEELKMFHTERNILNERHAHVLRVLSKHNIGSAYAWDICGELDALVSATKMELARNLFNKETTFNYHSIAYNKKKFEK